MNFFVNSAAAKGNVQRLKSYAAAGADPLMTKDMYGRTPLHAVSTKYYVYNNYQYYYIWNFG